jgi:predicted nucleotidyltransferase
LESYAGRILVEDASGTRFYVHEYRGRRTFVAFRRYMLDTGEDVRRINGHDFEIVATGERLIRVADE